MEIIVQWTGVLYIWQKNTTDA